MQIFKPANILLPAVKSMKAWSVIACDQFTSDPEYWQQVEQLTGGSPSSLRMIIPEAKLPYIDAEAESQTINSVMQKYVAEGIFEEYENAYVLVERTLSDGKLRKGIVGMIDLEQYDWTDEATTPIRATEHTVEDRLPARVQVRENAVLEMPHIMIFIDDPYGTVIEGAEKGKKLYDFELMQGGGHIKGWLAKDAEAVSKSFEQLQTAECVSAKYGEIKSPVIFAIGDGNHSIAAAKLYWNSVKEKLSPEETENHPARFALAEVINIRDDAAEFQPIHKVIFETDAECFAEHAKEFIGEDENGSKEIMLITEKGREAVKVPDCTVGELVGKCEDFCRCYTERYGGNIDYIHGDEECIGYASKHGCAGILLPKMSKDELFPSVIKSGALPKKSFSIGHGRDKRYYLECRKIK